MLSFCRYTDLMVYLDPTSPSVRNKMKAYSCEFCWAELLRSHRPTIKLFTCLRAWRYVLLQHKHRRCIISPREWQQTQFFEMELPLHAVVTALNHSDATLDEPFDMLGSCYALYPTSAVVLDHKRRSPLYYALEQHWGLEKLSWFVDKTLDIVLEKDSDGLSLVIHAIMNSCPEELVIRLAVAASSRCIDALDEFLNGEHLESARRFCHRALQDFFAGVPKFPHSQCRTILGRSRQYDEDQARIAATTIRDIWTRFVDAWGHFGAPLLQRDIPEVIYPVIDSFVEVTLVAKGEPLTYQWFFQQDKQSEATPIEGATQSFIFISSSIQPHNEGIYYCEVTNRRGSVVSARMKVCVVDDRTPPDPTMDFVVDRALLDSGTSILRRLKACAGGRLHYADTEVTIVFQPDFFTCLDRDGNNVSDTRGAEIAILHRVADEARLVLRSGENLISCIFDIQPTSMGDLLRPALLWLPHFLVADGSSNTIVVEVDMKSGRVLRDVDHAFICEKFARVAINRLGTFAVISRRKRLDNDEGSPDAMAERARLFLLRPMHLSANQTSGMINVSLTLVRDLANCCSEAKDRFHKLSGKTNDPTLAWTVDSFQLIIRENFSLSVQIGGGGRVAFRWPSPSAEIVVTNVEISLETLTSSLYEDHPAFFKLPIHAVVRKTPIQARTRVIPVETNSLDALPSSDLILFERHWSIMVPFLRDAEVIFKVPPPTPSIVERTNTSLVLELRSQIKDGDLRNCHTEREEVPARPTEERNSFSPYFYVVEMAIFSPTFWRRYDQTWWFDKTKNNVIDGMYKVVHRGFDTKITISTTAYAGCVRVAWCSIDRFGGYSEPLLLTPLLDTKASDPSSDTKLMLLENRSAEMEETTARLQQVLDILRIDNGTLCMLYGLPQTVRSAADVVAILHEAKASLRACNFELALLLSGFKTLEQLLTRVKLARGSYTTLLDPFLRMQRVIPELESFPGDNMQVTRQLHELLREAYEVIAKLSSPGWMQYFLLDEWFENALRDIFVRTAKLLASDACTLQCARDLRIGLEASTENRIPWVMKTARSLLLFVVGRLQDETDRSTKLTICGELCHSLQLYPENVFQLQDDDKADFMAVINEKLLEEFESSTSQQALSVLRQQDSFASHLVCVTPHDGEKCDHVPEAVHFDLDPFIRGVNRSGMHLVIRVANVSLDNCVVQEFESKSRYRVTVREHELLSSLGGTLPESPPFTIHFSTP